MRTVRDDLPEPLDAAIKVLADAVQASEGVNDAIGGFVTVTGGVALSRLGELERALSAASCRVTPYEDVPARRSKVRFVLPWFDLFSWNGFRRERVLRAVQTGAPNAFLFAILIRRLNDWVPEVRQAARDAVAKVAAATAPGFVTDALFAILPTQATWGRWEAIDADILTHLLGLPGIAEALASKILDHPSGPGPAVLREAVRHAALDPHLSRLAAEAAQPAVRALCYRMLLERAARWRSGWRWEWIDKPMGRRRQIPVFAERPLTVEAAPEPILVAAAADRSAMVRRVAGDILIARRSSFGTVGLAVAEQLAHDKNPSTAERGRFLLARVEQGPPARLGDR